LVFILALSGTAYVFGQAPVANFRANVISGCAPLTVTFTDISTGNPTEWNWEFSNGTLSNAQNPVVTFTTAGTYSAKLVVRNASGIDEIERVNYITVFPSPTPNFSADITLGCVPVRVNFSDLSTTPQGSIVSWEWDFGDGATSTLQNPSHNYTNTGFYTITLTVTSSSGCKRTASRGRYIRVVDGVSTDFNFTVSRSCRPPYSVRFRNQSSGPGTINYTWNFGNGQTSTGLNPTTVYNAPGTYTVRLNAVSSFGCSGTLVKTVTITQTNTDFTAPANACLNQPVSFQNNSSELPQASFWHFGDGTTSAQTNPAKTYLTAGTYDVKMINFFDNCTDSITKTIVVQDAPAVDFNANDSASCQVPFTTQFTDLTPGATAWLWDFGDGNTSTLQNPSHTFTSLGNYTVSLTATTSAGCQNTLTRTEMIKISETTIAINAPTGGCVPFLYTPVATIETLDSIATWLWDFGDGTTSTLPNPPGHTYAATGSYDISLTVTTTSGCTKTLNLPGGILTGTPPTVNFTFNPVNACASEIISFNGQAVTTPGADVTWLWDFGDGNISDLQSPTHKFEEFGPLNVTLAVSNNGCVNTTTQVVQVRPPVADFEFAINCVTRAVTFVNTSRVNPALAPLTYEWSMGDPANTQFLTPIPGAPFTYPGPGTYNVRLIATNGTCADTITKPVVIIPEQFADFSVNRNPVCKNQSFNLAAINSTDAYIANYAWQVGPVVLPSAGRTISRSFSGEGSYDVTLTITDLNGCLNTKTVPNYITVTGPTANFVPATAGGCQNKTVTFNDLSTSSSSTLVQWEWDFGDGTQQVFTAPPFTHSYADPGRYDVSLKVTDATGCTDQFSSPAELIVTNPQVGFRADTFYCPGAPLPFVDTSSGAGLTYFWEFGDGTTSTLQHPQHSYPLGDAEYSVKLKITDISGCQDSILKTDYIRIRSPKAAFGIIDTTTICPPLRTGFTFQGSDYQSFFWDFGDGGSTTAQNPNHFYSDYGHFTPKLYLTGPGGCVDSAEASVTIYDPMASVQLNYGPVTTACNSLNVDFNITIPPAFKFTLFFGDGTADSSQATTLSHFYSRPSFSLPRIVIYDTISGCEVAINGRNRINVLGAIPLFGKDKEEFCDQGLVTFRNFTTKNEPIISTVWDFGDGTTSNAEHPSHNFTAPGLYTVTLNVTTQSNCSRSFSDTILVYRTPAPSIQSRDTICVNSTEQFDGILATADTLTNWQWTFGNGQTSTLQNNVITFNTAGDYAIRLTTSNKIGCNASTTKNIYVAPLPTATPAQDPLTIAVGMGANILMNYTGNIISYNWLPATRLSCTDCPAPFANPQYTTKYTVEIEDRYGCRNSGDITIIVVCGKENIFIPNTFSPNGDGRNEVFYPKGTGLFRIKSMRVFNRWGEVVFEKKEFAANDPSVGWNGTFKGKTASPDVYIYTMEILCENNTVIPVKGNVTLLR
jgi:gliding motility-associated-like protein